MASAVPFPLRPLHLGGLDEEAWIRYRGKWYTLGRYDDEVEAARARDRKAYELHGDRAYLNLPDEIRR